MNRNSKVVAATTAEGTSKIRDGSRGLRALSLALAVACPVLVTSCADNASLGEEANGESASMKGDWAAATPLFEKANAAHPDALTQFNLATAYENTGQSAKAVVLYEAVVLDGQFTPMNSVADIRDSGAVTGTDAAPGSATEDLSVVATKRLAIMASRKALFAQLDALAHRKVLPVAKVLICDFPGRNGNGAERLGEIIVYVDDDRRTASTLGFFVAAANQQEVDRFDSAQIVWTQRYQFAGHTDTYRYMLNRRTASLDVTRPFPDANREAKVTATCHPAKA